MAKLTEHLRFFICKKIQERHWEECFAFGKIELHCPLKTNCKLQSYWMLLVYSINECSFLDAAGCKHCASRDRKIQPGNALQWSFLEGEHKIMDYIRKAKALIVYVATIESIEVAVGRLWESLRILQHSCHLGPEIKLWPIWSNL